MVTRVTITPAEFDRRQDRMRSRWAELIELLKTAKLNEGFEVPLDAETNDAAGRKRARQSIYAIARHHGMSVRLCSSKSAILVMKTGNILPPEDA